MPGTESNTVSVYFAPMEGLTDAVFRRVHHALSGGADAYYLPFISPTEPYPERA